MGIAYINREGSHVGKAKWQELQKDDSYKTVRQYDNGAVRVTLTWNGRIDNFGQVYEDYYKMFELNVFNYTSEGKLVPDPVQQSRFFPKEAAAVAAYEEFLTEWTKSGINRFGEFEEADNSLAPPPPPNPDRPDMVPDIPELGGVGAW